MIANNVGNYSDDFNCSSCKKNVSLFAEIIELDSRVFASYHVDEYRYLTINSNDIANLNITLANYYQPRKWAL